MELLEQLWSLPSQKYGQGAAIIIFPILSLVALAAAQYLFVMLRRAWNFMHSRRRALDAVRRELRRDGAREGKGVWLTAPIRQPDDYNSRLRASKVLAISNLKGGVGKTTLAANIGACLATTWGKRVLLIDFDFQGSLSSMTFPRGGWLPPNRQDSIATQLISNDIAPGLVSHLARNVSLKEGGASVGQLKIITSYYDLAQADNRILVEWLLAAKYVSPTSLRDAVLKLLSGKLFSLRDIRYDLAKTLHSDSVQDAFDLIIIDCPPRLTTSAIQALCASTHLLIPTIFDLPSAEAVVSFCRQAETLKKENICPYIKYLGVIGTMWQNGQVAQTQAMISLQDALQQQNIPVEILSEDIFFPRATNVVNDAEQGIAYIAMPDRQTHASLRLAIEKITNLVVTQMGIPRPKASVPVQAA